MSPMFNNIKSFFLHSRETDLKVGNYILPSFENLNGLPQCRSHQNDLFFLKILHGHVLSPPHKLQTTHNRMNFFQRSMIGNLNHSKRTNKKGINITEGVGRDSGMHFPTISKRMRVSMFIRTNLIC